MGKSGITHEVDIVEVDGRLYIFADTSEKFEEVLSKLLIAMDTDMPIYLLASKPIPIEIKSLLHNVEVRIVSEPGKPLKEQLNLIYEKVATAKWYLKMKGVKKNVTHKALQLLSDFYGSEPIEGDILSVLIDILEEAPEVLDRSFFCELMRRFGCPKCGSLDIEVATELEGAKPYCKCLKCGFTIK